MCSPYTTVTDMYLYIHLLCNHRQSLPCTGKHRGGELYSDSEQLQRILPLEQQHHHPHRSQNSRNREHGRYIEHLNLFMVGDSTKIERFPEILSSKYGSTPPRLLVFIGSMSLIFREEIQSLWGKVPAIVCGADPYVYHEKFYRQRDTVTPEEKTHMSELAEEFNFTYMHTPIYLEENVQLMCRMIPGMKKLIFLGDGIYPIRNMTSNCES